MPHRFAVSTCVARLLFVAGVVLGGVVMARAVDAEQPIDRKYPLGEQLKVLAHDVVSEAYRRSIDEMLTTDLAAEWKRVATEDNPETFAERHGGLERVLADAELQAAYERRVEIREKFLELMRIGYRRYNRPAPFDQGETAERAGTLRRQDSNRVRQPLTPYNLAPDSGERWPRFRGPNGQGNAVTTGLPVSWSPSENVAWRVELPGVGNSSPVIWDERLFLTFSDADGANRSLGCWNRHDGQLLWTRAVPEHEIEPQVRDKNGFASATPVTNGRYVVAFLGNGGILCCDMEGNQQWHHRLPDFNTTWGTGASPLIYDNQLILIHDQNKADSFALCLDLASGQELWRQPRDRAMGWATPIVVRVDNQHDELIYPGGETVKGYDPATGKELWTLRGPTHEVIPTVVVGPDMLYSASGRQGPTIGFSPGGRGDVTETHLHWRLTRGGPLVPTPVYLAGRLFTVNDMGIASCADAETGELIWQSRLSDKFSASPIECEGLLYCCAESGVTYVLRAGDTFEVVAENDLAEPILASPAAVDGVLYVRTSDALYALRRQP